MDLFYLCATNKNDAISKVRGLYEYAWATCFFVFRPEEDGAIWLVEIRMPPGAAPSIYHTVLTDPVKMAEKNIISFLWAIELPEIGKFQDSLRSMEG